MKKPAVSRLDEIAYDSIRTVVLKNAVNQLIPNLMVCGAEKIPGIPIVKIVPWREKITPFGDVLMQLRILRAGSSLFLPGVCTPEIRRTSCNPPLQAGSGHCHEPPGHGSPLSR
ncbi:MAG: hypothetical protein LUO98_02305 [Methanoregula sp.]|nr:hypothetical protein [Methanoregula sp.]